MTFLLPLLAYEWKTTEPLEGHGQQKKESLVSGAHQLQTFPVVMKCIACARDALQKALKHRIV